MRCKLCVSKPFFNILQLNITCSNYQWFSSDCIPQIIGAWLGWKAPQPSNSGQHRISAIMFKDTFWRSALNKLGAPEVSVPTCAWRHSVAGLQWAIPIFNIEHVFHNLLVSFSVNQSFQEDRIKLFRHFKEDSHRSAQLVYLWRARTEMECEQHIQACTLRPSSSTLSTRLGILT